MKWYRVETCRDKVSIIEEEVEKETEQGVYVNGRRCAKDSTFGKYFNNKEDAINYRLGYIKSCIATIEEKISYGYKRIEQLNKVYSEYSKETIN